MSERDTSSVEAASLAIDLQCALQGFFEFDRCRALQVVASQLKDKLKASRLCKVSQVVKCRMGLDIAGFQVAQWHLSLAMHRLC